MFPEAVSAVRPVDGYFSGRSLHRAVLLLLALVFRAAVLVFQNP
jgi:hypothetical protein